MFLRVEKEPIERYQEPVKMEVQAMKVEDLVEEVMVEMMEMVEEKEVVTQIFAIHLYNFH